MIEKHLKAVKARKKYPAQPARSSAPVMRRATLSHCALTRRPAELTSTEEVEMHVVNRLPRRATAVED